MYIMIKFYLPGAFELPQFNMLVFRCMMNNPEWFYDRTNVDQVYGSCPNMLWNSGRVVYDLFMPMDIAKRYIETYNSIGVGVRFTFTNSELEEKHLGDTYCNMICEYIENTELNSVLVSSPLLEEYLRKTYPNLRIASSITKGLKTKESIIEETKREDYDCMVLPTQFNKDFEWLETIENKDKVEILLNVHCEPSCPRKSAHYKKLGQIMCNCGSGFLTTNPFPCTGYDSNFYTAREREDFCSYEDLKKFEEMGFSKFKLEGREACYDYALYLSVIDEYAYYMVKPEYKDIFRYTILKETTTRIKENATK